MSDTTTNWRQLQAGRALDRIVAERCGYSVRFFFERTDDHEDGHVLYGPNGYAVDALKVYTAGAAGAAAAWDGVPAFSTSADAALALPIGDDHEWTLFRNGDGYCARLEDMTRDIGFGEGANYADAMCRAWLSWRDSGGA